MSEELKKLYNFITYKINEDYAKIAITCSAYANENSSTSQDSLAIVGDHVIKLVISSEQFLINNHISKKEITHLINHFESNHNLEDIGLKYNVDEFLLSSNKELEGNKKRATTIEAIIGAIYLSEGLEKAKEFMSRIHLVKLRQKTVLDIIPHDYFDKKLTEMNEYGYQSIVFCVIDAVFSIGANYSSTKKAVERFSIYNNLSLSSIYTTKEFINKYNDIDPYILANQIFVNKQRTSTKNGILKAEAVVQYLRVLNKYGINTKEDFLRNKNNEQLKKDITKIKGQSKLTTFKYILMLSGDTSVFKPDRHIINFFKKHLGIYSIYDEKLEQAFNDQLQIVKHKYSNFDTRSLDGVIWQFMSKKSI